jgi:hypothetical protein
METWATGVLRTLLESGPRHITWRAFGTRQARELEKGVAEWLAGFSQSIELVHDKIATVQELPAFTPCHRRQYGPCS